MRLFVDTKKVTFQVSKNPEPKVDQDGKQRHRRDDGAPMWTTQVVALDEDGGQVLPITVAGNKPEVSVGQTVSLVGLEAMYWTNNGRSGLAYRAESISAIVPTTSSK